MSLVVGEYGKTLAIDAGIDLTGQTGMQLTFTRPDGSVNIVSSGLAVGVADLVIDGVTYPANKHITYHIVAGDFPIKGIYKRQLQVDFGVSKRLFSITESFEVLP